MKVRMRTLLEQQLDLGIERSFNRAEKYATAKQSAALKIVRPMLSETLNSEIWGALDELLIIDDNEEVEDRERV